MSSAQRAAHDGVASDWLHFWLIPIPPCSPRSKLGRCQNYIYRPRCSAQRTPNADNQHEHRRQHIGVRGTVSEMSVTSKVISLDRVSICAEQVFALFSAMAVYEQVRRALHIALKRFGQLKPLGGVKLMPAAKISTNVDATNWDLKPRASDNGCARSAEPFT